jgi:hypothetical protein
VALWGVRPAGFGGGHWLVRSANHQARTASGLVDCQILAPLRYLHRAKLRLSLSRGGRVAWKTEHVVRYYQTRDGFGVRGADLWWPRDAGEPALYDAVAEFVDADGTVLARDVRKVGLRTVRLERADWYSEENPGTFRFLVNGVPIYMHGTDWTPMDALHSRDGAHLARCLDMLVDLNCNMIRIWGGGVYEPDALYDFCDANGICVWQDFMMGNVEPEQNDDFAARIASEAKAVVLMIGTNNNYGDKPEATALGIKNLLAEIRAKQPEATILLVPVFPRGEQPTDPKRINNANVNALIKGFADGKHVIWVDFNSRLVRPDGTISKDQMPDFLHPRVEGYRIWAETALPYFKAACGK